MLAIDQAPKEKDGTNALIGKTVTLELKPEQTETLARARQSGVLSLALRSIADNNATDVKTDENQPEARRDDQRHPLRRCQPGDDAEVTDEDSR